MAKRVQIPRSEIRDAVERAAAPILRDAARELMQASVALRDSGWDVNKDAREALSALLRASEQAIGVLGSDDRIRALTDTVGQLSDIVSRVPTPEVHAGDVTVNVPVPDVVVDVAAAEAPVVNVSCDHKPPDLEPVVSAVKALSAMVGALVTVVREQRPRRLSVERGQNGRITAVTVGY